VEDQMVGLPGKCPCILGEDFENARVLSVARQLSIDFENACVLLVTRFRYRF
jgi:hypothetical protein